MYRRGDQYLLVTPGRSPPASLHALRRPFLVDDQIWKQSALAPAPIRILVEARPATVVLVPIEGGPAVFRRIDVLPLRRCAGREGGDDEGEKQLIDRDLRASPEICSRRGRRAFAGGPGRGRSRSSRTPPPSTSDRGATSGRCARPRSRAPRRRAPAGVPPTAGTCARSAA